MVNKEVIKEIIDIFASGCTLALVWVLIATFLTAFFSPDMKVTVTINEYGEAWFELPLIIFIGIGAIRNLFRQVRDLKKLKEVNMI
jgi:TRAP-type C4-dicarboxylate transport system permease small subunit